jgi:hypothetical protein
VATWTLQFLQIILTWPVCTFAAVVFIGVNFREALSNWIADAEALWDGQKLRLRRNSQQVAQEAPAEPAPDDNEFPAGSKSAQAEQAILLKVADIENALAKQRALARIAVRWQLATQFEWVYANILGSQLTLLQKAFTGDVPMSEVRAIYEDAVKLHPTVYANYAYDAWFRWLIVNSMTAEQSEDESAVRLTYEGREFFEYVRTRGYVMTRPG